MVFDHQGKPIIGFDDSSALPIIGHTSTGDNIYGTLHFETASQPGTGVFLQEASANLDSVPLEPPLLEEKPLDFLAPVHDHPGESYCKTPGPAPTAAPDVAELNSLLAGLLCSSQAIVNQSVTTTNCLNEGVLLTGPQNYAEWELSIKTSLILKDLEIGTPVTLDSMSSKEDKEKYKRSRQAFALLIKSLSPEVQASLPANIRSVEAADSLAL
ncbi:hypothetical protein D1P53_000170 [Cryptococcus gattii VGV]|nr:hypothetical protein D1P53_000170 [Cryptococcus gattii VGV]